MSQIRVVLVDDHPIVLQGLRLLFERQAGFTVLASCTDADAALETLRAERPDVLVLDLRTPGRSGLDVLRTMAEEQIACRAVLLTANWTSYVWAVTHDNVVETALGYFMAPIGTMLIGVFVLHERLRRAANARMRAISSRRRPWFQPRTSPARSRRTSDTSTDRRAPPRPAAATASPRRGAT